MAAVGRVWRALSGSIREGAVEAGPSRLRRSSRKVSAPYPLRTCHFCNEASLIVPPHPDAARNEQHDDLVHGATSSPPPTHTHVSTGTPDRWYCVRCMCWNTTDVHEFGGIATWDPAMADERLNNSFTRATPGMSLNGGLAHNPSPFCHTCQTNQTLLLNLVANHDEQDDVDKEGWLDDLQVRYPPVCATCQERVDERIQAADSRARKLIWAGLLQQRAQQQRGGGTSLPTSPIKSAAQIGTPDDELVKSSVGVIWQVQRLCYIAKWLFDIAAAILQLKGADGFHGSRLSLALCTGLLLHSVAATWDPTRRRRLDLLRQSRTSSSVYVNGTERWKLTQQVFLGVRLSLLVAHLALPIQVSSSPTWIALLASEVCLSWYLYPTMLIRAAPRVSLHSRRSNGNGILPDSPEKTASPLRHRQLRAEKLKQDKRPKEVYDIAPSMLDALESDDVQNSVIMHNDDDDNMDPEDSMDWTPTPANEASFPGGKSSAPWAFGPQRIFAPQRQTGLEDLVSTRLAIDDDQNTTKAGPTHLSNAIMSGKTDSGIKIRPSAMYGMILALIGVAAFLLHSRAGNVMALAIDSWRAVCYAVRQWLEQFAAAANGDDDALRDQTMWGSAARMRQAQL